MATGEGVTQRKIVHASAEAVGTTVGNDADAATSIHLPSTVSRSSEIIKLAKRVDRCKIVATAYVMLGVLYLLPWVVISTACPFYTEFKLKWLLPESANDTGRLERLIEYRGFFVHYIGVAYQIPNTLATVVNLLVMNESDCRPRLLILSFVITWINAIILVLALVDSRSWPEFNILVTFILIIGLGFCSGLLSSVVWASTVDFPGMELYINVGSSIVGIVVPLVSIVAKLTATKGRDAASRMAPAEHLRVALMYFMVSLVICCASLVLFSSLRFNKFYRSAHQECLKRDVEKKRCKEEVKKLKPVFAKTWRLQITLLYLLIITIACFPSLQLGIVPQESFPAPIYYMDIVCFLNFNVASLIGNFVTLKMKCPGPGSIWIPVFSRTLFVPFLMFCNYNPEDRNTPVLFYNDAFHGVASALLGFSNGYFIVLLMEQIFKKSLGEGVDVGMAMKLGACMIVSGVAFGILFGLLLAKLAVV